jgi:hypothetical protein
MFQPPPWTDTPVPFGMLGGPSSDLDMVTNGGELLTRGKKKLQGDSTFLALVEGVLNLMCHWNQSSMFKKYPHTIIWSYFIHCLSKFSITIFIY